MSNIAFTKVLWAVMSLPSIRRWCSEAGWTSWQAEADPVELRSLPSRELVSARHAEQTQ
jgi:hypothetical protein